MKKINTYPLEYYNSPFGSLILIKKLLDKNTAVHNEIKKWEKLYIDNENDSGILDTLKKEVHALIKNTSDALQLFQYNTIRGPIFRLGINGMPLSLREDNWPEPTFIAKSSKEEIC